MKYLYDFHLHSCLSPCGDNDMTPYNLVNMAKLLGYDIIALTDHNSSQNCEAAINVGKEIGLTVVPGMELCTSEEAHIVCLFPDICSAMQFSDYVLSTMPEVKNRPQIFGDQLIMDSQDGVIGTQEKLLTIASSISVSYVSDTVKQYGGICYPAHIDRSSFSVISNLGMITPDMNFSAVELTEKGDRDEWKQNHPILNGAKFMSGSDAHYLENMTEPIHALELPECTAESVIDYLKSLPLMK